MRWGRSRVYRPPGPWQALDTLLLHYRPGCQVPGASQRKITRAKAYITPPACQAPRDAVRVSTNPSVYILNSQECRPGLEWGCGCKAEGREVRGQGRRSLARGHFCPRESGTGAPSSNLGSATLNKQVRLGLRVHIWAKRASGKSPIARKGSGSARTLPPTSLHLDGFSPPASRPETPKQARDTQTQARPHTQPPLLKYIYTQNIF